MFKFRGGVHPPGNKATADMPIKTLDPPEKVVLPCVQHIGAPAVPLVKKGDRVLMGQIVAGAGGPVSSNIHSPVSGEVIRVEQRPHPSGSSVTAIEIANDGEDRWIEDLPEPMDWEKQSPSALRERIKWAGIVGMGGAAFPTDIKLNPPPDKPIDILILNGCECEPVLTADYRLMLEEPDQILIGARIMGRILGAKRIVVGIEDNKEQAVKKMREASSRWEIDVISLPTKYPQGSEKQLIYAVCGRKVPPGKLPMAVGALVQNVATARAVEQAVGQGKPLLGRVLTLAGGAVKQPGNYHVRLGTLASDLIQQTGGLKEGRILQKLIFGGPMMGVAQPVAEVPVVKSTSGILALTAEEIPVRKDAPCIRCGMCVDACPMNLLPVELANAASHSLWDESSDLGILNCIECGSCAYVCPANRPLVNWIRAGKFEVNKRNRRAS